MAELNWDAEGLRQTLTHSLPGLIVEVVESCGSTNSVLIERARSGSTGPYLLLAQEQTQGRGRMGRTWYSADGAAPGASLTFSLAMPFAPQDWQGLSLAVGVALAEAFDPLAQHTGLKWPNDVWLMQGPGRGRKLAGTLIESVASQGQRVVVVGVGINVLPQAAPGAGDLLNTGFASLQEISPGITAPSAWHQVLPHLVSTLLSFEKSGFAPFVSRFTQRDLLRGQPVHSTQPGAEEGICEGIDAQGALLLRASNSGVLHNIHSGEVSVRPKVAALA